MAGINGIGGPHRPGLQSFVRLRAPAKNNASTPSAGAVGRDLVTFGAREGEAATEQASRPKGFGRFVNKLLGKGGQSDATTGSTSGTTPAPATMRSGSAQVVQRKRLHKPMPEQERLRREAAAPIRTAMSRQGGLVANWFDREAAQQQVARLADAHGAPSRRPVEVDQLTTLDNQGVGLSGGRVYVWNQKKGLWHATGMKNVQCTRLGGDGRAYALTHDGTVQPIKVVHQGELADEPVRYRLRTTVQDIAVSPAGSLAVVDTSGKLAWMPSDPKTAGSGHGLALPMPEADRTLRSVAFDGDGTLYALDTVGQVWRANPLAMLQSPGEVDWQRVALPAPGPHDFVALKSLRGGTVAGIDKDGVQWPSSGTGSDWQPIPLNAPRELDRWYADYRLDAPTNINRINFSVFGPEGRTNLKKSHPLVPGFLRKEPGLDHPGEKLGGRLGNFWQAHYGPPEKPGRQLRDMAKANLEALPVASADGVRRMPREVLRDLAPHVDRNADAVLTRLERALGMIDGNGAAVAGYEAGAAFRKVRQDDALVRSDRNVLFRVLTQRDRLYPRGGGSEASQAISQRLRTLLDQGVFLPVKSGQIGLRRVHNDHEVLTNKLVHDHMILGTASREVLDRIAVGTGNGGDYLARTGRDVQRLVTKARSEIDGGDDNPFSRLFADGVDNLREHLQASSSKGLKQALRADRQALLNDPDALRPMPDQVRDELGPLVTENARKALDTLEQQLGLVNADGQPDDRYRLSKAYLKVRAPAKKVRSKDNALWVLYQHRLQQYHGAADPEADRITQRLHSLLQKGIYLDLNGARRLVAGRDPGASMQLHWTKNKYHVLTGKMLSDMRALAEAAGKVDEKTTQADAGRICQEARDRIEGRDGNGISRLFSYGMVNADRGMKALDNIQYLASRLGRRGHRLHRALTMAGRVKDVNNWIDRVMEMAPGESITIKCSRGGGFDFDGLGLPFSMSERGKDGVGKVNVKFNPIPNIQPVPSGMATWEHSVTISRTESGIELSFGQVREADLKPLAAKLMWGAGATANVGIARGVVFGGFEVIPGVSINIREDNSVSMTLNQNDSGVVRSVMKDLFRGAITPYQLLDQGVAIRTARGLTKSGKVTVDTNLLLAGVGILGVGPNRAKGILAALEQLNLEIKHTRGRSSVQGADGRTDVRVKKTESSFKRTDIIVVEGQHAFYYDTVNPHHPDRTITDAAEVQSKIPVWIYLRQHLLWGNEMVNEGGSLRRDKDGKISGVDMLVRTLDTPIGGAARKMGILKAKSDGGKAFNEHNLPQLAELLAQQPELRPYIDKIRSAKLPVHALLELKPEAMAQVAALSDPSRQEEAIAMVQRLSADPRNWRIAEIKVDGTRGYKTSGLTGVVLLRYTSRGENLFTTNLGKVVMHHGKGDAPRPSFEVRGELLVGRNVQPDFDQLSRTHRAGGSDRLESLLALRNRRHEWQVFATMPHDRTRPGEGLAALGSRLLSPLDRGRREPHLALQAGQLVYRTPVPGGWRQVDVPENLRNTLVDRVTGHSGGVFGADAVMLLLLQAMSHRESGRLAPATVAGEHLRALERLAAAAEVPSSLHTVSPDAPLLDRALHVTDILDDLRSGHLSGLDNLDPAQRLVLQTFFRTNRGRLDREALAQVLSDPVQLHAFKQSILAVEEGRRRQRFVRSDTADDADTRLHQLEERKVGTSQNSSQPMHTSVM